MLVREIDTAREFLSALQEYGPNWVFRGQSDAGWSLLPSIHRPSAYTPLVQRYLNWDGSDRPATISQVHDLEALLISQFIHQADHAGLFVPREALSSVRSAESLVSWIVDVRRDRGWIPEELVDVAALGQHYGLPTRLLDWTRLAKVAAFFAAKDSSALGSPGSSDIAVWGIHAQVVMHLPVVDVVRSPSSGNPNLTAQRGLFTMQRILPNAEAGDRIIDHLKHNHAKNDGSGMLDLDKAALQEVIDEQMTQMYGAPVGQDPPFTPQPLEEILERVSPQSIVKVTLPQTEAASMMRMLRLDGVTSDSIFPGYGGAVQGALEGLEIKQVHRF